MMRSSESPDLLDVASPSNDDGGRSGVRRLRAATLDEAVARVEAEFGHDAEIVEANRIRRGGVGGFFATDLGVEVVVDVHGRTRQDERPHFYDRVVEEDDDRIVPRSRAEQPADVESAVERLIAAAERGDRGRRGGSTKPSDDSFAAHFERELARPEPVPAPTVRATSAPVDAIVAPDERPAIDAGWYGAAARAETDGPDDTTIIAADTATQSVTDSTTGTDAGPRPRRRGRPGTVQLSRSRRDRRNPAASHADGERTDGTAAPTPAEVAEVTAADTDSLAENGIDTSAEDAVPSTASPADTRDRVAEEVVTADEIVSDDRGRDVVRRQIDLAAGAIGRVVEQLSDVVALDGSRVADLSRLTISVTGPDGTRIEVAAELFGGSDAR
jgi:hypothetical protein